MTRILGPEASRAYQQRIASGFIDRYLSGDAVLDIGYRGGISNASPITEKAIGVELDYPGYDGVRLPFDDGSQDAVFSSHCLEHISNSQAVLADWYRVLKIGGYLVIAVPHQYLYERKATLPSRFNRDHKRMYTPASLMSEVERALPLDGYRIRSLRDNDEGFDYTLPPEEHAAGCYEIELVIEKIVRPVYGAQVGWSKLVSLSAQFYAEIVKQMANAARENCDADRSRLRHMLNGVEPPPYAVLEPYLDQRPDVRLELNALLMEAPFDAELYGRRYPDIGAIVAEKGIGFAHRHYVRHGYFEGRLAR